MYEAVAQSIQGIEELFALIKHSEDLNQFTQKHIKYNAGEISGYIRKNDWEKEACVVDEFKLPKVLKEYTDDNTFVLYRNAIDLLKKNILEIRSFYKRYARVYNQYKHGQKVGMRPNGHGLLSDEKIEEIRKNPLGSTLHIFANNFENIRHLESMPAIVISLHQGAEMINNELQELNELKKNNEMLLTELEHFDVQNAIYIVTRAAALTSVVWSNIGHRIDENIKNNSSKYALPTSEMFRQMIITVVREDKATC